MSPLPPPPAGTAAGVCRACGRPILRAVSALFEKPVRLDRAPDPGGTVRLTAGGTAERLSAAAGAAARAAGQPLYQPHALTCPHAGRGPEYH